MILGKDADPVLRRFQIKFIAVTASMVGLLLLAVLAVACYMTYTQRMADIDAALDARTERMHLMPAELMLDSMQVMHEYGFDADGTLDSMGEKTPGRQPNEPRNAIDDPLVATSAFLLDENGDIQMTVSNALSLDETTVEEAVDDLRSHLILDRENTETGKIDKLNLYYQLRDYVNGYSVAFASGNYVDSAMASLMMSLGLAELVAFLALAGLAVVLSRWVLEPVERAWAQQRQFVADASHELKTPLTVIRANDSLIMANPEASIASQMQWIESTETEAKLMQDLVNDMLYLAQTENARNDSVRAPIDFSDLVQSSVLQFESVAFERGVLMDSDVAAGLMVNGEPKSLQRLVGTLIDNACKYADDGGKVDVSLSKQGGNCVLRVHNTGAAIPAEDVPHVFDRFYRSDKARTHGTGGFGLGLAIAKSVVDEHGATIAVTSSESDGTVFTVTFPKA
ncbi:MAG: sensor histidine kinase [Eggerthellaceae bacterium]|nr:sensor histidine kinase [Eggerthellaceae bacterium]